MHIDPRTYTRRALATAITRTRRALESAAEMDVGDRRPEVEAEARRRLGVLEGELKNRNGFG